MDIELIKQNKYCTKQNIGTKPDPHRSTKIITQTNTDLLIYISTQAQKTIIPRRSRKEKTAALIPLLRV